MQVPASTHETTCLGRTGRHSQACSGLAASGVSSCVCPARAAQSPGAELVSVPLSACVCSVCRDMQVCGHGERRDTNGLGGPRIHQTRTPRQRRKSKSKPPPACQESAARAQRAPAMTSKFGSGAHRDLGHHMSLHCPTPFVDAPDIHPRCMQIHTPGGLTTR